LIGILPGGSTIELPSLPFLQERRIQGSMMGSTRVQVDIPTYVEFYKQGRLDLDALVTDRILLEDIGSSYERMPRPRSEKRAGVQVVALVETVRRIAADRQVQRESRRWRHDNFGLSMVEHWIKMRSVPSSASMSNCPGGLRTCSTW
jgi:hypothetical protein